MSAVVVLGSRLAFGVGLDEESAEVRNELVDLLGLGFPPRDDPGIERIGRLQAADRIGAAKFADRYMRTPYGRQRSASAATFTR